MRTMQLTAVNLLFILLGCVAAVLGRTQYPEVPELAMTGAFLVGLGIQWLGGHARRPDSTRPPQ